MGLCLQHVIAASTKGTKQATQLTKQNKIRSFLLLQECLWVGLCTLHTWCTNPCCVTKGWDGFTAVFPTDMGLEREERNYNPSKVQPLQHVLDICYKQDCSHPSFTSRLIHQTRKPDQDVLSAARGRPMRKVWGKCTWRGSFLMQLKKMYWAHPAVPLSPGLTPQCQEPSRSQSSSCPSFAPLAPIQEK